MPKRRATATRTTVADDPPDKKTRKKKTAAKVTENGDCETKASKRVTRSQRNQKPSDKTEKSASPTSAQSEPPSSQDGITEISETSPVTCSRYFEEEHVSREECYNASQAEGSGSAHRTDCAEDRVVGSDESDSDAGDWEEVEDVIISDEEEDLSSYKPSLPEEGISVELEHPWAKKRKAEKADLDRKRINRKKRQIQELIHKTHFLCLFARGFYLNSITMDERVQAFSLSHICFLCQQTNSTKKRRGKIKQKFDTEFFAILLKDFTSYFELKTTHTRVRDDRTECDRLLGCLETKTAGSDTEFILAFISIVRCLKVLEKATFNVRLCLPIRPLPLKATGLIRSEKEQQRTKAAKNADNEKVIPKGKSKRRGMISSEEEDEDVVIVEPKKISPKRQTSATKGRSSKQHKCPPLWTEIYVTDVKRWLSVDVLNGLIDEPLEIEKTFEEPFNYVIAYDDEMVVKELSCRYAEKALTAAFNRPRVAKDWLNETLSRFRPIGKTSLEIEEDKQLNETLASRPMPKTISEFKGHPLYVLKRHLLVYDAIYPPDTGPCDYFRDEPVYSRSCVKPVRSKEYWKRKARVLKEDAYPYKVVKGRKKWDKYAEKYITDLPKELYGFWQTQPYEPPVASDGKVPRNEFGNVELFQPCMLPIGTVHIRLPGLTRIANKLGIDCVPAVIGFDNSKSGVIPVLDGYIVCEEFKETLLAAFDEEQHNSRKREQEKRLKRVYANWRRLTRALLIRERLKRKYKD